MLLVQVLDGFVEDQVAEPHAVVHLRGDQLHGQLYPLHYFLVL